MDFKHEQWREDARQAAESMGPIQTLILWLMGSVYAGEENLVPSNPDNPKTPLYYFSCARGHGLQKSYRQGHAQKLYCPRCSTLPPGFRAEYAGGGI